MAGLTDYINIIKQLKRGKSSFTTPMTKTTAKTQYRAMSICRTRSTNYGSPPWNTGAALRFLSFRRDFLQGCWRSKAALKPISSTKRCCCDAGGGIEISKRLFIGLRLLLLFLNFPEETRKLLGPGTLVEGRLAIHTPPAPLLQH